MHDAKYAGVQDFTAAFTPIQSILEQDNAVWKGGSPALGLKCAAGRQSDTAYTIHAYIISAVTLFVWPMYCMHDYLGLVSPINFKPNDRLQHEAAVPCVCELPPRSRAALDHSSVEERTLCGSSAFSGSNQSAAYFGNINQLLTPHQ